MSPLIKFLCWLALAASTNNTTVNVKQENTESVTGQIDDPCASFMHSSNTTNNNPSCEQIEEYYQNCTTKKNQELNDLKTKVQDYNNDLEEESNRTALHNVIRILSGGGTKKYNIKLLNETRHNATQEIKNIQKELQNLTSIFSKLEINGVPCHKTPKKKKIDYAAFMSTHENFINYFPNIAKNYHNITQLIESDAINATKEEQKKLGKIYKMLQDICSAAECSE